MKVAKISEVPQEPATGALFTGGDVSRQAPFTGDDSQNFNFGVVNFSAGSRNKFHKHTSDQLLIVTEGTGVVATEQEERTVTTGDVILIPAAERRRHGARGGTPMTTSTIQA